MLLAPPSARHPAFPTVRAGGVARLVVLLVGVLFATAPSRVEAADDPRCGDCHTTGRVAHEHPAFDRDSETEAIEFCSVSMELDPEALGLDWMPCPKCLAPSKKEAAEREWNGLMALRTKWLADRREVDKLVGKPLMHVQTKHFVLAWDIPKIKIDRRVIRQHEAMHLYAERLETLYERIMELQGIDESAMLNTRFVVAMFESFKSAEKAAPVLTNNSMRSGQKVNLIGHPKSACVSWDDPEKILGNDEYRYQFMVHAVSHNIWHTVREYKFWLFKDYGWVYEGLAYYMEAIQFGPPIVSCGQEQIEEANWQGKSWEANVKKALIAKKYPSVLDVMAKSVSELTPMERQFAWSYIDFLMWENPGQMDEMLQYMMGDQIPTRDALKKAYDLTMGQFIDQWEAFVRSEYSTRPAKGPKFRAPKNPPTPPAKKGSADKGDR